ncbi:MAG: response regulator [Actinomycetia bacterium]|nr:response regulator [Actinomycetes bacterium]
MPAGPHSFVDVFIAEDDETEQMLLKEAFERAGVDAETTFVDDGMELVDLLNRRVVEGQLPDVIVLDLKMPRMDGMTFLEGIRNDFEIGSIPAVVLTNSKNPRDRKACVSLGVHEYLIKPSSFDELVELARSLSRYGRTGASSSALL